MMRSPALVKNPRRVQTAQTKSAPAPVGGLNDRDPFAEMDEKDAVILDNIFPLPSQVMVRKGRLNWSTGLPAQVETLMAYQPQSGTSSVFAASGTAFYNVTSQGVVGGAVVSGLTNARWQKTNVATTGGSFLMAVNGSDKLRGWDGSAWWVDGDGMHDITGVDTSTCIDIINTKHRVWLVQKATASAWYLPVDSIAGAAVKFDLGPLFKHGGFLTTIATWTIDGGIGPDDYTAFIGSNGDVIIYRGTDPSSATTWAEVGQFYIGSPIGRRCFTQYGPDVALISQDGLGLLSTLLPLARASTSKNLTDKIQNTISAVATLYGSNFGWQVITFPGMNMLIMNVPVGLGQQQQYVMNTISGAWCRFKGWGANCFELFNNDLYFGGAGVVSKAWQGQSDAGVNIAFEGLQAFNYFGTRDALKEFVLARPVLAISNTSGLFYGINTDFDMTAPSGVPSFVSSTAGQWGTGLWGSAKWGGSPTIQKGWQGVGGYGYCAAMHIIGATSTGIVQWNSTDYAFKAGGIL